MSFLNIGLGAPVLKAVEAAGYTQPTPIQAAAIPAILAGRDIIGIAQTGTGKTAAFVLPILTQLASQARPARRNIRALILAPTRELAAQIEENIRTYAQHLPLQMVTVFGGVSERPQISALRRGVEIVVATPGRLIDLMGQRCADFNGLEFLVLDEADRMLDMGFLPDIKRIVYALPQQRQTLLFSATLSREIESLSREFLDQPQMIQIGRRSNPAATVSQSVYEVPRPHKASLLVHLLREQFQTGSVLVFSGMKHTADRVAHKLESQGIPTATLHSNRSQSQRQRALQDFKNGKVRVLVATDIAARGIDVDGIGWVVNYDFPKTSEDYIHRIGRTGRAEATGNATSFITPEDRGALRSLERHIGRPLERKQPAGFDPSLDTVPLPPRDRDRDRGARPHSNSGPRPHSARSESRNGGQYGGYSRGQNNGFKHARRDASGSAPRGDFRSARNEGYGEPRRSDFSEARASQGAPSAARLEPRASAPQAGQFEARPETRASAPREARNGNYGEPRQHGHNHGPNRGPKGGYHEPRHRASQGDSYQPRNRGLVNPQGNTGNGDYRAQDNRNGAARSGSRPHGPSGNRPQHPQNGPRPGKARYDSYSRAC